MLKRLIYRYVRDGTWKFESRAGIPKGACLRSLTINHHGIEARSRALLFAPVGVLDFKLLGMVARCRNGPSLSDELMWLSPDR